MQDTEQNINRKITAILKVRREKNKGTFLFNFMVAIPAKLLRSIHQTNLSQV